MLSLVTGGLISGLNSDHGLLPLVTDGLISGLNSDHGLLPLVTDCLCGHRIVVEPCQEHPQVDHDDAADVDHKAWRVDDVHCAVRDAGVDQDPRHAKLCWRENDV